MSVTAAELVDLYAEAIRARLAGEKVKSYGINGRNLENDSLDELQKGWELAKQLAASETQATAANNKAPLKMWGVRYGRPT